MKVIFSRKGFDSQWGGSPSPIMPDGTLVSFSIPDEDAGVCYSDLKTPNGISYLDLMRQLPVKKLSEFDESTKAHVDPDLRWNRPGCPGWRPTFGQSGGAQGHLVNEQVKAGDLFLFFGWFRQTELIDGKIRYKKRAPQQHVLFGYLQIGEIIDVASSEELYPWLADHPHVHYKERRQNTLYIAAERLSFNPDAHGAGTFCYSPELVLTAEGKTRSNWVLPAFFHPSNGVSVSHHGNLDRWGLEGNQCSLKTVAIGQEFVVCDHDAVEEWSKSLVNKHAKVPALP
jgi:hypothetical protein